MATVVAIARFNDALTVEHRDGTSTATSFGTVAYTDGLGAGQRSFVAEGAGATFALDGRVSATQGGIAVRFRRRSTFADSAVYPFAIGSAGVGGSDAGFALRMTATNLYLREGVTFTTINGGTTPDIGDWHTAYIGWDATTLYLDAGSGQGVQTSVRGGDNRSWGANETLRIGHLYNSFVANADIDDILMLDDILDSTEWAALQSADAWSLDILDPDSLATRTLHPVLKIGSSHIGPLRVGKD